MPCVDLLDLWVSLAAQDQWDHLVLQDSRESLETLGHRVPVARWVLLVHQENLAEGEDLVLMEPGACQARLVPRVIGALTGSLGCLERRGTGVKVDLRDPLGHRERTEKEETMGKLDQEDFLVNLDLVVYWALKDLLGLQDPLV